MPHPFLSDDWFTAAKQIRDEAGHAKDSFTVSFFTGDSPPKIAYEIHVQTKEGHTHVLPD